MGTEITNIPPEFDRYYNPDELRQAAQDKPMRGYPKPENRWHMSPNEWDELAGDAIIVPPGPWEVWEHPSRQQAINDGIVIDPIITPENPIDPARTAAWKRDGLLVTDLGLPLHPLVKIGVTTEFSDGSHLGMATGIGRERYYGELRIGNIALKRLNSWGDVEYSVVTTKRGSKEKISFAGGYAELGESLYDAAVREGQEEANIVEACESAGISWSDIEQLPNNFWRLSPSVTGPNTIHAWLGENFLMINATSIPDMQAVELRANDSQEVSKAEWRRACDLVNNPAFSGAHRRVLRAHLKRGF